MTDQSRVDWAAVRHAYEVGGASLASLARDTGVPRSTLGARRQREGWLTPPAGLQDGSSGDSERSRSKSAPRADAGSTRPARDPRSRPRSGLAQRLMRAISSQLERLETGMRTSTEMTSADHEREARALSSLIRNFEKLTEMGAPRRAASKETGKQVADGATSNEQDRFRRDVAERIVRLREQLGTSG